MRRVEWAPAALSDIGALDRPVAQRVKDAVIRFAATGVGDTRKLKGIDPPEFRLRVGDWRVRFCRDSGGIRVLRVRNRRETYR